MAEPRSMPEREEAEAALREASRDLASEAPSALVELLGPDGLEEDEAVRLAAELVSEVRAAAPALSSGRPAPMPDEVRRRKADRAAAEGRPA